MAKVFAKTPPKLVLDNNDLYNNQMENHHYEEPEEKDNRVFINMQRKDEMNRDYEPMEERKLLSKYYKCVKYIFYKVKLKYSNVLM